MSNEFIGGIGVALLFTGVTAVICATTIINTVLANKQERWKIEHKEKSND
jgi:hypothetical protein